ncbi:MAG: 50S ribosomal protein L18 [Deltaproteobacteria bacterium CG11_big_fil_rev_8_21_14_0_20_45_16]|nr:MAG: 50S ribosomal protein L18 [Deltaproteobacteria bacterium CG11_big_fil_rev_8_21_14_0_20_45_16]
MALAQKAQMRINRKRRIRKSVKGSSEKPRLSVFRSAKYIYAQIISDTDGKTLCACSSLEKTLKSKLKSTANLEAAKEVGRLIGERAKQAKIDHVVFDRNGFQFHGRIKVLADSAREAGLKF